MAPKTFIYGVFDSRNEALLYIGRTTIGEKRWRIHLQNLAAGKHSNRYLQRFYCASAPFTFRILEVAPLEELAAREMWWIADARAKGVEIFNVTPGGEGRAGPRSEETKAKISAAKMGSRMSPLTRQKLLQRNELSKINAEKRRALSPPAKQFWERAKGEDQHLAKMTDALVAEIRGRYRAGIRGSGVRLLAAAYGVRPSTMHAIVKGKTWKHVPMPVMEG